MADNRYPAQIGFSAVDGTNGFQIIGFAEQMGLGRLVASAGDINGDGVSDLLVDVLHNFASPDGPYVFFGRKEKFPARPSFQNLAEKNGFRLVDGGDKGFEAASLSAAGDVNGDGVDDFIVASRPVYAPNGNDQISGSAFVVFGKASGSFGSVFDLSKLDGSNGFKIPLKSGTFYKGPTATGIGDVNGDGVDDVYVAGLSSVPGTVTTLAESYVIYGRKTAFEPILQPSKLDVTGGFRVKGIAPDPNLSAIETKPAGDLNGDGVEDFLINEVQNIRFNLYAVFGRKDGFGAELDLAALDGRSGFKISTAGFPSSTRDVSVAGAGDINGDGLDDVIVGVPTHGSQFGGSYVVFGRRDFDAVVDLAKVDGTNGFHLVDSQRRDQSGRSVSGAGDFNGDGFADFLVSSPDAVPNGEGSGAVYLVFGRKEGFGKTLDLATIDGTNGIQIIGGDGALALGYGSGTAVAAGDVNGDGFDDIVIGSQGFSLSESPGDYGTYRSYEGAITVFYGGKANFTVVRTGTDKDEMLEGGSADDTLSGMGGNDRLVGKGGSDRLSGGDGDDVILGQSGNDVMSGGNGIDKMNGGDGADRINGGQGADVMTGGSGDDTFVVDNARDRVIETAGGGTDTVVASASFSLKGTAVETLQLADTTAAGIAGTGNELANIILGNAGANRIDGGGSAEYVRDTLIGNAGNDTLTGGDGTDFLDCQYEGQGEFPQLVFFGASGADTMAGGEGDDHYGVDNAGDRIIERPGGGFDEIIASVSISLGDAEIERVQLDPFNPADLNVIGSQHENYIIGSVGSNRLDGRGGNDHLRGLGGKDTLIGGAGDDELSGFGGDRLEGGTGNDTYYFDGERPDTIIELAGQGTDTLIVRSGSFASLAGTFVEHLIFFSFPSRGKSNEGIGNALDNRMTGGEAADILRGAAGNDVLIGNGGGDTLEGGRGSDALTGGGGRDNFLFASPLSQSASSADTIKDFNHSDDTIWLDDDVFSKAGQVPKGDADGMAALAQGAFWASADGKAHDKNDRIIYDTDDGRVFYDADGSGAGKASLFATLSKKPAIDASDFMLVT